MRLCTVCKTQKEIAQFSIDRSRRDGLRRQCKACAKIYNKKYRTENPKPMGDRGPYQTSM